MKFPLSWLKEHLATDADVPTLVEALTMVGIEVEHVDDPAAKLAAFTVAKVLEAKQHPNADRLRVCTVETKDGVKQIVCGAPNARTGLVGVYAPLGTYIPGHKEALDAKPRAIRGVESHGMLCSAEELETGADAEGIIELQGDWAVGAPAAEALGANDPVFDVEVTPNRPDWLGVVGIARDLAAKGLGTFLTKPVEPVAGSFACPVSVKIEDEKFCPAFGLRLIRGVKNGPSPEWLQKRLKAVGLRPINALVDVTNLISLDRARPLHVFDAGKVKGGLVIRRAKEGESMLALDGKTYALDPSVGVIADDKGVESLAGVMGGEATGCTEATVDVLVESALWDPIAIARTGRKLAIASDAQARFARGVDPKSVVEGLELATRLILELCGGEPSQNLIAGKVPAAAVTVDFAPDEVERLTGLDIPEPDIVRILTALGFTTRKSKGRLAVTAPSWRGDVEGPADLVEEVARIWGFDKLPEASLKAPPRPPADRHQPAAPPRRRGAPHACVARAARGDHLVVLPA